MTLPTRVPITQNQVINEFTSISGKNLRAYLGAAPGVPTSGNLKLQDFLGKSNDSPIESTCAGGAFTTSGGVKTCTITNTNATSTFTVTKIAQGSYANWVKYVGLGAGGTGGGGGPQHQTQSNGSRSGGGGGGGAAIFAQKTPTNGMTFTAKPGKAAGQVNGGVTGTSGGATALGGTGIPSQNAAGGGGGGAYASTSSTASSAAGRAGGSGGGAGGKYSSQAVSGGVGSPGKNGGGGGSGGSGGGGSMGAAGNGFLYGGNDTTRGGGKGGNAKTYYTYGAIGAGGGGASGGDRNPGVGGTPDGGSGGICVKGTAKATAGTGNGAGGGGGGAQSTGTTAEPGRTGSHGVFKISHPV